MMGDIIVIGLLALCVVLSIRSMWKNHKKGGGCGGNCSQCSGCKH